MRHFPIDEFHPLRIQLHRLVLGIGLAISLTAFPDPASASELSAGIVKIGIVNDQAGPLSDLAGPGSVVAAKMALDDFRKLSPELKVEIDAWARLDVDLSRCA